MKTKYYPAYTDFSFYAETDELTVDLTGRASGSGYYEPSNWDHPGSNDVELDEDSLTIKVWTSDTEDNEQEFTLDGKEAYDYLEKVGWTEEEIEWEDASD